jgi:hypothetical protein
MLSHDFVGENGIMGLREGPYSRTIVPSPVGLPMASQVPEWILLQLFRANFAVLKLRSTEPSSAHNAGILGLFGMTQLSTWRRVHYDNNKKQVL